MDTTISRRKLLSGLTAGAGAAVLGWNPAAHAWVTDPSRTAGMRQVPPLDGTLELPPDPSPFSHDFGRLIRHQPRAVLTPGSVDDVVKVVRYARDNGIKVAVNGQSGTGSDRESHSHYGQALVDAGIAIDPKPLAAIHRVDSGVADVGAGATWSSVVTAALATGQAPAVANDFAHLSVGGTLSVGGLGGTSQRFGTQADNVTSLRVVTGRGELVTCSKGSNPELFDAVLAGGGQYGLIVRASLRLVPAKSTVRSLDVTYDDLGTFLRDSLAVMHAGVVQDQNGYAEPVEGGGWRFRLALAMYYTPPAAPDLDALRAVLSPGATVGPTADMPYRDWLFRFDPGWAQLKAQGFWAAQKPWLSVMLAAERTAGFVQSVLSELTVTDLGAGTFRISPLNAKVIKRPNFVLPDRSTSDIFETTLVRFPAPNHPDIPRLVAQNRRFYDRAVGLGGKRYLIGAIPNMSSRDWQRHYGNRWSTVTRLKRQYDPAGVLTPGQRIFV
jgi:FAD/FMN-containing dehydrogenase